MWAVPAFGIQAEQQVGARGLAFRPSRRLWEGGRGTAHLRKEKPVYMEGKKEQSGEVTGDKTETDEIDGGQIM